MTTSKATCPTRSWAAVLPHAVSSLRVAMAVLFPLMPTARWRATVILVAGLSDLGDGFIARRLGVAHAWGGHLDAISDKVFVLSVLVTLLVDGLIGPWQVALLLSRDLAVASIAAYVALLRQWSAFERMPARWAGKVTTAAMFTLFLTLVLLDDRNRLAGTFAFAVAAACSLAAAVNYIIVFCYACRGRPRA